MSKKFDPVSKDKSQAESMSKSEIEQHFTAIQTDFSQIFGRFGEVDRRFDDVDNRFNEVDKRFDNLENRMEKGFKRLESICFAILELVRSHDLKFSDFERRLIKVERKVA